MNPSATLPPGCVARRARPTTSPRPRYRSLHPGGRASMHLAVQLLRRAELLVARLVLRELERFLAAERQDAEHHQRIIEQRVHPVLQRLVEVDEHVATEDHVK